MAYNPNKYSEYNKNQGNVQRNNGEHFGQSSQNSNVSKAQASQERFVVLCNNNLGIYPDGVIFNDVTHDRIEAAIYQMLVSAGINDNSMRVRATYNPKYGEMIRNPRIKVDRSISPFEFYLILTEDSELLQRGSNGDPVGNFLPGLKRLEYNICMTTELADKLSRFIDPDEKGRRRAIIEKISYNKTVSFAIKLSHSVCMRYMFGIEKNRQDIALDFLNISARRFQNEGGRTGFNARVAKFYVRPNNKKRDKNFDQVFEERLRRKGY